MNSQEQQTIKENVNVVFMGHVDHGKSSLIGSLLVGLQLVQKKDIERLQRIAQKNHMDSWYLAYLMDCDESEQKSGKTQDIAFKCIQLPNRQLTIIDAPGHKTLIQNFITGLVQADIAVMVVSAKKNEFQQGFDYGSFKEHLQLAVMCNIQHIIFAINKMDLCEHDQFDPRERFQFIKDTILSYIKQQKYKIKSAVFIPTSSTNSINIIETHPDYDFGQGLSLKQMLGRLQIQNKLTHKQVSELPTIVTIMDKPIDIKNQQDEMEMATYCGRIEQGTLQVDQQVVIMPYTVNNKIKHIYTLSEDDQVQIARPGQIVYFTLYNNSFDYIQKGSILHGIGCNDIAQANEIMVELETTELDNIIITKEFKCIMHMQSYTGQVTIKTMFNSDKKQCYIARSSEKINAVIQIDNNQKIAFTKYENNQKLGSFVLRINQQTIANGKILKYKPKSQIVEEEKQSV